MLVTGANGFVGRHVCRHLHACGYAVLALVRDQHGNPVPAPGVTYVVGDVTDINRLCQIQQQHGPVHGIVHLATEPPAPQPRLGTNEAGMAAVLESARVSGPCRIVFTSTMSVFDYLAPDLPLPLHEDHPVSPSEAYGVEKYAAEVQCRQARRLGGQDVVILRLAGVYGPGKAGGAVFNFLRAAQRGQAIQVAEDRAVDLLWVEDAAQVIERCLQAVDLPDVMHIGSGVALRLSDLALAAWQTAAPRGTAPSVHAGPQGNRFVLDTRRARAHVGFSPTPLATALCRFHADLAAETLTHP